MTEGPEAATVRYTRREVETKKGVTPRDVILALALMLLGLGLRMWDVGQPAKMYFDEIYYVDAADKLWAGKPDPNSVHPPLGKWLIGLGIRAGDALLPRTASQPMKWRLASVVSGTLSIGVVYALGLLLFNYNRTAAAFAAFIMATEHLHLASSRIAMLDPMLAFFCLLGMWMALVYFMGGHEWWGVGSAFVLGLATGIKWSGLFTAFGCLCAGYWMQRRAVSREKTVRYFFWLLLLVSLGFLCTYAHLFLSDGWGAFAKMFGQAERMREFRYDEKQFTHRYLSYFWSWPLVLNPIWLFFEENKTTRSLEAICAMGVPTFWWGFTLLLIERAYSAFRTKDPVTGALVILWVCQWLPWCVSTTGGFFYYMLTEVPIMALLVGKLLADLLNFQDALGEGRWRGWLMLAVYLVGFAVYLPFALGKPAPRGYFNTVFFSTWVEGNKDAIKAAETK